MHEQKLKFKIETLKGFQSTIWFLSPAHTQYRKNAFTQNHFFKMFLSHLRVKLPITKTIANNIFRI